jgi:hypothetical protein
MNGKEKRGGFDGRRDVYRAREKSDKRGQRGERMKRTLELYFVSGELEVLTGVVVLDRRPVVRMLDASTTPFCVE